VLSVDLTPQIRMGAVEGGPDALGGRVVQVAVSPRGSVHVVEPTRIVVFDSAGAFVRQIGKRGRGPGEFNGLTRIGWLGDTLWAADRALRRFSKYDPHTGELTETTNAQSEITGDYFMSAGLDALTPAGALHEARSNSQFLVEGLVRWVPLLRVDRGGGVRLNIHQPNCHSPFG